jgi:aarF domain-containing kinase
MSRFLAPCRICLRQFTTRSIPRPNFHPQFKPRGFTTSAKSRRLPLRTRILLATAPLSPAAFVALSQGSDDGEHDGKTGEERMLEQSRAELDDHVPRVLEGSHKWRRNVYFFVDIYIWEPICTTIRFFHLFIIFVPVILTVPAIWIGVRVKDRDDERSGTLWWYGYLVWSMEQAGAAFIKVMFLCGMESMSS